MAKRTVVACLVADGFEDSELRVPYERLTAQGIAVELIGTETGKLVTGKRGKEHFRIERSIADVKPQDYAALLIPGGHSPDQLRSDARFVDFVRNFDALNRPLAAVCHGPQLLMSAGLVKGRTLTAWSTIQNDLRQMGALVKDQAVVKDRNWITSRKPEDLEQFSSAILDAINGTAQHATV